MSRRPVLKPGSPQTRGLILYLPWNTLPSDQQGLFVRSGSLGWQDGIKLGGVSSPTWFRDPRFGLVPDFGNDTSNRALTSTSTGFLPVQLNPLSASAWFWPHSIDDNAMLVGRWVTSQAGWAFRTRFNSTRAGIRFDVQYSTTALAASVDLAGMYVANTWNHLAVTWDGSATASTGVVLYVNGVANVSNRVSVSGVGIQKDDSTRALVVGASNFVEPTTGKTKGRLGPVKVWNRVLTPAEIVEDLLSPELIVPAHVRRRRYFSVIGKAGAPSTVEATRSTTWGVGQAVEATRSTTWALAFLGFTVETEANASWAVFEYEVTLWPTGPVNKVQLGQYEVRIITPRLIELILVHTNNSVNTRPSRWSFVAGDWITLNTLPPTSTFVVQQTPPP